MLGASDVQLVVLVFTGGMAERQAHDMSDFRRMTYRPRFMHTWSAVESMSLLEAVHLRDTGRLPFRLSTDFPNWQYQTATGQGIVVDYAYTEQMTASREALEYMHDARFDVVNMLKTQTDRVDVHGYLAVGFLESLAHAMIVYGGQSTALSPFERLNLHVFDQYDSHVFYDYVMAQFVGETDLSAMRLFDKMNMGELLRRVSMRFHGIMSLPEYQALLDSTYAPQAARVSRHAVIVAVYSGYNVIHHFLAAWHVTRALRGEKSDRHNPVVAGLAPLPSAYAPQAWGDAHDPPPYGGDVEGVDASDDAWEEPDLS